jgi:hypothetical protein
MNNIDKIGDFLLKSSIKPMDVINGFILSDLFISTDGYASIDLSGAEHIDWLYVLKDAFTSLSISMCTGHPKIIPSKSGKYHFNAAILITRTSPLLLELRKKWYPNGKKIVPADIEITPVTLAHWFMGDGSSGYNKTGWSESTKKYVSIQLATCSFTEQEVDFLVLKLQDMGLIGANKQRHEKYFQICIRQSDSVVMFMQMIDKYMVQSYRYKIRLPDGRVAQPVEQLPHKETIAGSNPVPTTN